MYKALLFLLLALNAVAYPVDDEPLVIKELTQEINFDGRLDEGFWQSMTQVTTTQHIPVTGQEVSEGANIYLTYDKEYLYIAANIYGDDIRSPSQKRDEFGLITDYLGILIDGYNDQENALAFFTTPTGLRSDFTVFEDAIGDFPVNQDWNTFWDVKTVQGDNQWSVEVRIPFTSLQFQDDGGEVTFGVIVWRHIASKNEISTWPLIENEWGPWSHMKPSKAQKVTLKGVKAQKPIYISPYVLGGLSRSVMSNPYQVTTGRQIAAGLDLKYSLTSNVTVDVTINTDFAQVEADDAQVNLDRFNLFLPEKRQFFQERASIFDLRVGGPNRIFYSRKIGIDDDGNLDKVLGGVRLTGRIGDLDVGLINIATRDDQWGLKSNSSVLRFRKKVYNSNSYIGFIGTNKTDFDGQYNSVYGLDGTFRLMGNHLLQLRWAQSFTDGYDNKPFSLNPSRYFINLEKTQFLGFNYDLAYSRMGEDYNPALGFEDRSNYSSYFAILGYGWRAAEQSKILQQSLRMYNFTFINNPTQLEETTNIGLEYIAEWKNGHFFNAFTYYRRERLFEDVGILDDFIVKEGFYNINVWSVGYQMPGTNKLQYGIDLRAGDIFDSKFGQIRQTLDWAVSSRLNIGAFYNYNRIYRTEWNSDNIINVHLARLKFLYTLNTKLSLNGFLQATSDANVGLGNIRFRYNPKEGVDLFLVYNNETDLNLDFSQENFKRRVPEQVVIAKFTYTFRL